MMLKLKTLNRNFASPAPFLKLDIENDDLVILAFSGKTKM
jgi:hypothetical protein